MRTSEAPPTATTTPALRRRRQVIGGCLATLIAVYGFAVPKGRGERVDQAGFLDTVARMRAGAGYYSSMRASFLDMGVRLGGTRAFRLPTVFVVWRWLPGGSLYLAFLVLVVAGTCLILLCSTQRPLAVVPVALYLLYAGRTPGDGGMESWLLVEGWTVPVLLGCLLAFRSGRWWPAALLAGLAVLMREITAPLLLAGLVTAHVQGRPRRPWAVTIGVVGVLFAAHSAVASRYTLSHGTEAALLGTGHPPWTVLSYTAWEMPGGAVAGLAVWLLAAGHARRLGAAAWPGAALLFVPLLGVVANRPYWGLVAIPLALLWAGEELGDLAARVRARPAVALPA